MANETVANGVLKITAPSKNQKSSPNPPSTSALPPRAVLPRLRLIVRRLPPGLSRAEFEDVLGQEWGEGRGKVEWLGFKEGKISKE